MHNLLLIRLEKNIGKYYSKQRNSVMFKTYMVKLDFY